MTSVKGRHQAQMSWMIPLTRSSYNSPILRDKEGNRGAGELGEGETLLKGNRLRVWREVFKIDTREDDVTLWMDHTMLKKNS